jgi:hypothetical protein
MSSPAVNPYQSPLVQAKLTDAEATDVQRRDIATLVLLFVVTLGFYWFYLAYQWAKELNGLAGRVKYQPTIFLIVNLVSCGMAGIVFECLYAFDIAEYAKAYGIKDRLEALPSWVIGINCAAMVLSLIPFGVIIGLPLGILASILVQVELNKLADRHRGSVVP